MTNSVDPMESICQTCAIELTKQGLLSQWLVQLDGLLESVRPVKGGKGPVTMVRSYRLRLILGNRLFGSSLDVAYCGV